MIKEFCLAWEKNKDKLEEYFRKTRQEEYGNYEDLVKLLFDIVINPSIECDHYRLDTENILVIDDGDYQGTQVFILHRLKMRELRNGRMNTKKKFMELQNLLKRLGMVEQLAEAIHIILRQHQLECLGRLSVAAECDLIFRNCD